MLLGRHEDRAELARLADEGYPFVYIGRRDIPGRELTYVTADYAAATRDVVCHLADLGHRNIAYLGANRPQEPDLDRVRGFESGLAAIPADAHAGSPLRISSDDVKTDLLRDIVDSGATALLVEDPEGAHAVFAAARQAGIEVPADLSIAVLGDASSNRRIPGETRAWSGFRAPGEDMGRESVRLLLKVLEASPDAHNRVLPCVAVHGATVGPPRASTTTSKKSRSAN